MRQLNTNLIYNTGLVYPDECDCSKVSIDTWLSNAECKINIEQINTDLSQFQKIDFNNVMDAMVKSFTKHPYSMSICQYVIKNNLVRKNVYFYND